MRLRDLSLKTKLQAANVLMVVIPIAVLIVIGAALLGGLHHTGSLQQQALALLEHSAPPLAMAQAGVTCTSLLMGLGIGLLVAPTFGSWSMPPKPSACSASWRATMPPRPRRANACSANGPTNARSPSAMQ